MKINFLFTGTFWGIILILFGISALLRSFNINIPIVRIIFGVIIIYVGITIISGGSIFPIEENNIIFSDLEIKITNNLQGEYNIIFGNGIIDLTEVSSENYGRKVEINAIFGAGQILITPNTPVKIKTSSAFGRAAVPDGTTITFGDYNYTSGITEDKNIPIEIEANAIFGSIDIRIVNK